MKREDTDKQPKGEKTKATKTKAPRKTKKQPTYNNHTCPAKMTLEQWQIALRKQQAQAEDFAITANGMGEYCVMNSKTKQEYKVVYRGANSPWNFCSCMDFKTSQLGTCKHIEAVKQGKFKGRRTVPPYTSVYLDYVHGRSVRIRFGTDNEEAFRALARQYFDASGVLNDDAYATFGNFLDEAKKIDDTFRCYTDAKDFIVEQRERTARCAMIESKYNDEAIDKLLKYKLYSYQKEGIRFAAKAGKSINADEMGLGKTIQAIGTAELLRKEHYVENILIVTPTSLKYQWKQEIERFAMGAEVVVIEGNHLKRREMYLSDIPYKIVSYNAMCNDIKILGKLNCDMLIMDEVQRLKNWNTQISKAARRIVSNYAVILSGTPLENKLEELFSIVQFADQYVLAPYYKFRHNHITTDDTGRVIGYKELNQVGELLRGTLIRRRKKDVNLQLPARMEKNLLVPMTEEQREMHDEWKACVAKIVMKWKRLHFISELDRKKLLLFLSEMRMVCDSTFILDQKSRHDTKVEEAMNIVNDLLENDKDGKVVIFSQWERMTRLIAMELEKRGIGYEYLHGGVPSVKRKDMVSQFNSSPDSHVFLSTDAGSTGLNLQAASVIINMDLPWNPAVLEQRIARIYRIGQRRNIQVINLVAAQTIEEEMIGKLKFKQSLFEGVLDGGEDNIFVSDDKFKKIMDLVGAFADSEPEDNTHDNNDLTVQGSQGKKFDTGGEVVDENDMEQGIERHDTKESTPTDDVLPNKMAEEHEQPSQAKELVRQGMDFLSNLANTLQSPEATEALIDHLVVEDKDTGETSIRIQVPNKQYVKSVMQLFCKLFNN